MLSGATDLEKLQEPEDLTEPMRWLWRALAPRLDEMESEGVVTGEYEGREVRVACRVLRPADVDALLPAADRTPGGARARAAGPGGAGRARPGGGAGARGAARQPPELLGPGRLPPLRLPLLPGPGPAAAAARRRPRARGPRRRRPRTRCPRRSAASVVHQLLEELDFAAPAVPGRERVAEVIEAVGGQPVRDDEVADVTRPGRRLRGLAAGGADRRRRARCTPSCRSRSPWTPAAAQPADRRHRGRARPRGRPACWWWTTRATGSRAPSPPTASRAPTRSSAWCTRWPRCARGAARAEVAYCFLERPDEPVTSVYTAADVPALEAELRELTAGVSEGRFEPTAAPHRGLCADCPGRPALCSWDEERTLAEPAVPGSLVPLVADLGAPDDPPRRGGLRGAPPRARLPRLAVRGRPAGQRGAGARARAGSARARCCAGWSSAARRRGGRRCWSRAATCRRWPTRWTTRWPAPTRSSGRWWCSTPTSGWHALGGHLRRSVLPDLPDATIVVIAGRGAPGPRLARGRLGEPDRRARARAAQRRRVALAAGRRRG